MQYLASADLRTTFKGEFELGAASLSEHIVVLAKTSSLPDGPEREERDGKLEAFQVKSGISHNSLWRGSPLYDTDMESLDYQFRR